MSITRRIGTPVAVCAAVVVWIATDFSKTPAADAASPDTTRPIVSATIPANGATDVALNAKLTVTFSEPMNSATMTPASFDLTRVETGHGPGRPPAAEQLTVTYTGITAILTPAHPLAPRTMYTASVRPQARDLLGHALAREFVWSFTTGVTVATTVPTVTFVVPPLTVPPVPVPPVTATAATAVAAAAPAPLAAGPAPVSLGTTAAFAVLAASTVTNTGATIVTGDLGLSPGTAVTGFPPGTLTGTIHAADAAASQAQLDLTTAYNDAAGRTGGTLLAGNLGGQTLTPGLYTSTSSLEISSGDLTLDAQGDINAIFLFQMASTFTMTSGRQVILTGGATAANVFWQVGSSATLGTGSVFKGNILALASITVATGAAVEGRLLARTGAVTLDTNTVALPAAVLATSILVNAGTGVSISGNIAATFSEAMDPFTITTDTFVLKQGDTPVSGVVSYAGVTALFNPVANLLPLTVYTATVTTGIKNLAGTALAADFSWSFTTGVTPDIIRPLVTATVPVNGASAVPINQTVITAAFSEAMDPLTITPLSFRLMHGTTAVNGTVSYAGVTATFTPTVALLPSTVYTATVTTGATDLAGNALLFDFSWSFSTGAILDTTPPTVTATVPADGATAVAINQTVNATFSEPMDPLTITTATMHVTGPGGTAVPGIVGYALTSRIATLTPASPLASNTIYTATLTGAKDLAGNALVGVSWSFTTGVTPVGQAPVALGAATTFAVLAASTVTSTGPTLVTGDLGLSPGTSVTGFPPGIINGTLQVANAASALAQLDLTTAYNNVARRTTGAIPVAGDLGGQTLGPGLYTSTSSLAIAAGDLTLDAQGDVNAVFIFQMGSTLTTTAGRQVILTGGAKAANVVWLVGSSATLGTGSVFRGTILAQASITVMTGTVIEGRVLARTAAVTLDSNTMTLPIP